MRDQRSSVQSALDVFRLYNLNFIRRNYSRRLTVLCNERMNERKMSIICIYVILSATVDDWDTEFSMATTMEIIVRNMRDTFSSTHK